MTLSAGQSWILDDGYVSVKLENLLKSAPKRKERGYDLHHSRATRQGPGMRGFKQGNRR